MWQTTNTLPSQDADNKRESALADTRQSRTGQRIFLAPAVPTHPPCNLLIYQRYLHLTSSMLSARSHLRQLPRTESDEHLRADKAGSMCFGMVKLKVPHSGEEADPLWDPSLQESLHQSAPTTTLYGIYLHQQHQPAKRPPCQSHQKSMKAQCPHNPAPQNPSVLHLIK